MFAADKLTRRVQRLTRAIALLLVLTSVGVGAGPVAGSRPPYTDYCEMLAQEIQGRKHAFLAGNKT